MTNDLQEIQELQKELTQFHTDLLHAKEWDVIIPIMRKGLFVLLHTTAKDHDKVRLLPLDDCLDLKQKLVLILDDTAFHGDSMRKAITEVMSAGADQGKISTAVFMKAASCDLDLQCAPGYDRLSDQKYLAKEEMLGLYYASLCSQLDQDHLVAEGVVKCSSLSPDACDRFPLMIEKTSSYPEIFYFVDSSAKLFGRTKFTIADIALSTIDLGDLASFFREEGVNKVRFCLEPDGQISTALIFCPEIIEDATRCRNAIPQRMRLCERLPICSRSQMLLCRDCLYLNLEAKALKWLVNTLQMRLKDTGFKVAITGLGWPELEYRYDHDTVRRIFTEMKQDIVR